MTSTFADIDFVNKSFSNDLLDNVIKAVYPNLNITHQSLLHENLMEIISIIAIKFNFTKNNRSLYMGQFRQNNYRDSISLLNMILPFVNYSHDKGIIRSLNDLYTHKSNITVDINSASPSYTFSNIQYGRCNRDNKYLSEIEFNYEHIDHNIILLKDTIQEVANKLFVNWIDVLPQPFINNWNAFRITNVVRATQNALDTGQLIEWDINDKFDIRGKNYSGLPISDIYNVLVNGFYEDIKNIKWLIYDAYIDSSVPLPFFIILQKVLPLDNALIFKNWNKLDDYKRQEFDKRWNILILGIDNPSIVTDLPTDAYKKLIKAIVFFFNKYSKNINDAIKNGYVKFKIPNANEIDEDNENLPGINFSDMKESAKSLSGKFLYDFLVEQFRLLEKTYYGQLLKKKDNIMMSYTEIVDDKSQILASIGDENLTYKNYYNFAKSLSHFQDKTSGYVYYGNLWKGLDEMERAEVLRRLNMKNPTGSDLMEWFNISKYLLRLDYSVKGSLELKHQRIFKEIKKSIGFVIGNMMAFTGIFSHFEPNPEISNERNHPGMGSSSQESEAYIKQKVGEINLMNPKKENIWENSYYFLTNKNYSFLGPYKVPIGPKEVREMNYNEYMTTQQTWYTTYAMNWVSQISFFHRYNNNRIFYVTGSTGVGKSTQIPKLLMYALKALDFNAKGKIVCTQPRIPPTEGNAFRISSELGLPIMQHDIRFDKDMKKENYTVQYKHQMGNHTTHNDQLSLKIVTDGTLYQELKNPFLKKRVYNNKSLNYTYQDKNIYDIVIVDEAHEHNANMDMILTLMKNTLYCNNSIKLIIISATMDDDEPIYRRFYRNINDNQMYPFNYILQKYNLDRINVDRRVHISPPGQTTRFAITEEYVPDKDPHDIVMNIINTTITGDILLFQPGEADISNSIQTLNKLLPSDAIALPYFSSMHKDKKQEIEKIESYKYNIIVSHDAEYKYFITIDDGKNINKVNKGTYKRIIIVATNIAEASITIGSLKFVVDTGKQKIGLYDPATHQSSLVEIPISESSRLQRKGRVGRVSSGTVYYMYKENSMINNTTAYNISVQDITDSLFSAMRNTYVDNKSLFNIDDIDSLKDIDKNIKVFVEKQNFKNGVKISYVGKESQYDYVNNTPPPPVYITGYDPTTLTDSMGNFYIIHPEELNLYRNIDGQIVGLHQTKNITQYKGRINSKKMEGFWDVLEERLCIIKSKLGTIKTEYGEHLYRSKETMKLEDIRQLIMYIFSRQYGVSDDIIKIIPLIDMCINSKISPNRWASSYINPKGKFRTNLQKLKHLYGNCNGDVSGLLKCINKLFNDMDLFKTMPTKDKILSIKAQKKQYLDFEKNQLSIIDPDVYQQFKNLDLNNKLTHTSDLTTDETIELIRNDLDTTLLRLDLESKESELQNWCDLNYIDYGTLVTYLKSYIRIRTQMYKKTTGAFETDIDDKKLDVNFEWFDDVLHNFHNITENKQLGINMALIHSYGSNICRNIDGSDMYINIQNPSPEFIYTIKAINPYVKTYDTLLDKSCMGEYLLYFAMDNNTDSLYMIQNVDMNTIQQSSPYLYTPSKLQAIANVDFYDKMIHSVLISIDTDNKKHIIERYLHTIKSIHTDLLNSFDIDIWRKLEPLCKATPLLHALYMDSIKEKRNTNLLIQQGGTNKIPSHIFNEMVKFCLN